MLRYKFLYQILIGYIRVAYRQNDTDHSNDSMKCHWKFLSVLIEVCLVNRVHDVK